MRQRADVFYFDVHLEIIGFFIFLFVSSRTTQDKNGLSTWRDHQSTRVCCVTNLHSSRFVAYPSRLVLSQNADCSDSSLPPNTFDINRFQMLLLVHRNQFSSFPTKRLDGPQVVNGSYGILTRCGRPNFKQSNKSDILLFS